MNAKDTKPIPEKKVVLANEKLEIVLSSQGGSIIQATLLTMRTRTAMIVNPFGLTTTINQH